MRVLNPSRDPHSGFICNSSKLGKNPNDLQQMTNQLLLGHKKESNIDIVNQLALQDIMPREKNIQSRQVKYHTMSFYKISQNDKIIEIVNRPVESRV